MDLKLNSQTRKLEVNPSYDWHLGRQLLKKLNENENKIHQIEVISGAEETRGSIRSRIIRLAQFFIEKNIAVGDIIMVCAVNHNDANVPFLSSLCIGAITVNLVVGMTKCEVSHIMSTARPKIIFTDPEMIEVIEEVQDELGMNAELVTFGPKTEKFTNFTELISSRRPEKDFKCVDFDPETTIAFITCSSGTTGLPKLVAINHKRVLMAWMAPMYLDEERGVRRYSKNFDDVIFYNLSPSYWITGIIGVLGSCVFGNTRLQMTTSFSVDIVTRAIEKYKPDSILFNPNAMALLCNHPEFKNFDLSSLRNVFTGGMMIDYDNVKALEKQLTNGIVVAAYGASEAGFLTTNPGFTNKSVGKIYPWIQWKVVDIETEAILGPNQPGELRVKSDYVLKYYNNEKATKEAMDKDGYYKTGDLFYYDNDENLYIIDRVKEVIKYCGYQIGASEIEFLINKLPGIVSSAVIGVPDPVYGELPVGYVQKVPESSITEDDIHNHIKSHLSECKQLRGGVFFLPEIPQTHTGKISRKVLKSMWTTMKDSKSNGGR